jgi:hypothetical protein
MGKHKQVLLKNGELLAKKLRKLLINGTKNVKRSKHGRNKQKNVQFNMVLLRR